MLLISIIGARPQFIKAAVVSRALKEYRSDIHEKIVHTGQHFDQNMSKIFFDELSIPKPNVNLGIGGGTHGQNTGRMIERIEEVLIEIKPDKVLVYGDTDSTLAGALSAVKLHIPVIHVEAGLRSFNKKMPEEINRILTDHISDLLFTPTPTATKNLIEEGINEENVHQVGDVMYDATLYYREIAENRSTILDQIAVSSKNYFLATIHRKENCDDPQRLRNIIKSLSQAKKPVVWPIHPRSKKNISKFGIEIPSNVKPIEPVGYLDMLKLEKHAQLIITDSGGVQKEAYFHGVPCLTIREETEWTELVEHGWNRLVSPMNTSEMISLMTQFELPETKDYVLFGKGNTGKVISSII